MNADIYARITGVNINLTDLVNFREEDMAEFTSFVKRNVISTHHNIRIEDIRKKYQLSKLVHRNGILEKLWKAITLVIAVLVSILIISLVTKLLLRICKKETVPPVRNYQLDRMRPRINIPINENSEETVELDSWEATEAVVSLKG